MIAYLDNSATTRPCPEAVAAVNETLNDCWGNPSSVHRLGVEALHRLDRARTQVAEALGAERERVFFTSGGTEADNWAVFSSAKRMGKQGKHIVTTAVEHHAILHPMQRLREQGFEVTYLQPDRLGRVTLEQLADALRDDTVLVSVMMVNNETGAVMPIEKMAKLVHRRNPRCIFHTDAVQGFFKVPFRARTLGADLISVSGHKIHAVKGVGALYVRPDLPLPPYLHGGGQEKNFRSGTEAMPAICAMGAACAAAYPTLRADIARQAALRDGLIARLNALEGVEVLGAHDAPHIVSCALPGIPSQNTINILQEHEVFVSAGSACSRGKHSHVLAALGLAPELIDGSIRVSLSRFTQPEEIDLLLEGLQAVLARMKR